MTLYERFKAATGSNYAKLAEEKGFTRQYMGQLVRDNDMRACDMLVDEIYNVINTKLREVDALESLAGEICAKFADKEW